MRAPGKEPNEIARLYGAAIEMAAWADATGCASITLSEHHAAEDGYLSCPLTFAAAIAAVTTKTPIMVAAAILPLYDPVRLAEEMVILDHLSRGRVMYTLAVGYRPLEYDLFEADFKGRGAVADAKLATLLERLRGASAGSPSPRVTPPPFSPGGPMIAWGGATKRAARRAGRNGLGFIAQSHDPALAEAYREAAVASGHEPGLCVLPSPGAPSSVFVHSDLDAGWREVGAALLADAVAYYEWNAGTAHAETTVSLSKSASVAALRHENGSHRVVTIDGAVDLIKRFGSLGLQPLCGGLDPDVAWPYLRRVVDEVLPAVAGRAQPG